MSTHPSLAPIILKAIEQKGWKHLTLNDIAHDAHISLKELHETAHSKEDLLALLLVYLEEEMMAYVDQEEGDTSEDHLFDVLFAGFESGQQHKKPLTRLWQDLKGDPLLVRPLIPLLLQALKRLCNLGKLDFDGPLGALQLRAFGLIYLRLIHVWIEDASPDAAKTMAETNKAVTHYLPCLFNPCKIFDLF